MIRLFLAVECILFMAHIACASDGDAILGIYLTEERDSTIEIFN